MDSNIEKATVNGKLTSEYILDFENKKGTPSSEVEQEYLEIINVVRGHLQHYEQALTPPTQEEVCKQIDKDYQTTNEFYYHNACFYFKDGTIAVEMEKGIIYMYIDISPKSMEMLGRFYEGLDNE